MCRAVFTSISAPFPGTPSCLRAFCPDLGHGTFWHHWTNIKQSHLVLILRKGHCSVINLFYLFFFLQRKKKVFWLFFFFFTHLYLTEQNKKKVSGVLSFKHHIGFLITNESWQVCWVATCPILSVMLADSSALFSERRNMWKKLVFYISQLVTSSLLWTLTSHCAPNTPHGKCPHAMALWESCVPLTICQKKKKNAEGKNRMKKKQVRRQTEVNSIWLE